MNYRWMIIGFLVVVLGLFLYFLYKIPLSWVVSVPGVFLFLMGFFVKQRDLYAG